MGAFVGMSVIGAATLVDGIKRTKDMIGIGEEDKQKFLLEEFMNNPHPADCQKKLFALGYKGKCPHPDHPKPVPDKKPNQKIQTPGTVNPGENQNPSVAGGKPQNQTTTTRTSGKKIPEKKEEKSNWVLWTLLILTILIAVAAGVYYYLQMSQDPFDEELKDEDECMA